MTDELDLEAAIAALLARGAAALHDVVTETVFARSQELVPVGSGALADSGVVSDAIADGDTMSVTISYGTDPATAQYAVPVHENMQAIHPSGQAKWLETAQVEAAPGLAGLIAAKMR